MTTSLPRVALRPRGRGLRFTRGYRPRPLRGREREWELHRGREHEWELHAAAAPYSTSSRNAISRSASSIVL